MYKLVWNGVYVVIGCYELKYYFCCFDVVVVVWVVIGWYQKLCEYIQLLWWNGVGEESFIQEVCWCGVVFECQFVIVWYGKYKFIIEYGYVENIWCFDRVWSNQDIDFVYCQCCDFVESERCCQFQIYVGLVNKIGFGYIYQLLMVGMVFYFDFE